MDLSDRTPILDMAESKPDENIGVDFSFFSTGDAVFQDNTREIEDKKTRKKKMEPLPARLINQEQSIPVSEVNYEKTYSETNNMLRGAIAQTDELSSEIKQDIDKIRASNTLKSKYTYLTNLTASSASLISTKISAIKEINGTITQAHNLELNRMKVTKENEADQNDDSRMMDIYKAFVNTPTGAYTPVSMPIQDMTLGINDMGSSISAIQMGGGQNVLSGPLTPEQQRMRMESNTNIQAVVKFDQSTGQRFFDVIDITNGASIPNYPRPDQFLLENTVIDIHTKTARNKNLDAVWPLVLIGDGAVTEY